MRNATATRPNPYVGPRAFLTGEQLYGRDHEARKLLNELIAERIVLLCSPSGAGKTSLIQAKLIPSMRKRSFFVRPVIRVNSGGDGSANRYLLSTMLSLEQDLPLEQQLAPAELAGMSLSDYLTRRLPSADPGAPTSAAQADEVLIFDQFEEILTLDPTDRSVKQEFFAQLGRALENRQRWALFAIREEFVTALKPFARPIPTQFQTIFRLDLLGVEAALAAMKRPTADQKVSFADDAARRLVDDLRMVRVQHPDGNVDSQPGCYIEPVQLQVVCYRLWERLSPTATAIAVQDISDVGDVDSALAGYYAEQVVAIARQTGLRERAIRDWCEKRLITDQDIRGQVLQDARQSEGLDNRAVKLLLDSHLVRADERRGATWLELAHDRLIGPIRASNAAWRAAHLSLLQRQAALWESQGRAGDLLLRDASLVDAEQWAARHDADLTSIERRFLDECRQARTVAEHERRAQQRIQRLAIAASLVSVFAVSLLIVSLHYYLRARDQERISLSRQLAAQSLNLAASNLDLAMLLGIEASRLHPNAETRISLLSSIQNRSSLTRLLRGHTDEVWAVVYSPDGKTLVSGSRDYTIRVWDAATGELKQAIAEAHDGIITSLAFSPDGSLLASAGGDGEVHLWDTASYERSGASLVGHSGPVYRVVFSPDGAWLASAGRDGTVVVWDITSRKMVKRPFRGHTRSVWGLAFSPDGKTLVSAGEDQLIIIWDLATWKARREPLTGHTGWIRSLAFSPDGQRMVSAGARDPAFVWNTSTWEKIGVFANDSNTIMSVAFSPDGKLLASASDDATIILWDVATRQPIGPPLTGHTDAVDNVVFSPDGKLLASGADDHKIILWDVATRRPIGPPLSGHSHWVRRVRFSSDEAQLISAGCQDSGACRASEIRRWDVASRSQIGEPLTTDMGVIWSMALSPDDAILATGGPANILLWDMATGQVLGEPLKGHYDHVRTLAFSPDGRLLASGSTDNSILLWDVAARRRLDPALIRHSLTVRGVAFSPDGNWLASASNDRDILLWDIAGRQVIGQPLRGHTEGVVDVAFSPDGSILASGGLDNQVMIWELSPDVWQDIACRATGRNLTRQEWEQYLGDRAYTPACPELAQP